MSSKTKQSPESELKSLISEHEERYARYQRLYEFGGQDPSWSDGCNMRLVRNHIIYCKNQIKTICDENNLTFPEEYYRDLPIEVDNNYMARREEIEANAKKSLEIYKSDENYLYLLNSVSKLTSRQKETLSIGNILGYVSGLESYINGFDFISMRRHERYEHYLESFKCAADKVKELLQKGIPFIENEQLSLF